MCVRERLSQREREREREWGCVKGSRSCPNMSCWESCRRKGFINASRQVRSVWHCWPDKGAGKGIKEFNALGYSYKSGLATGHGHSSSTSVTLSSNSSTLMQQSSLWPRPARLLTPSAPLRGCRAETHINKPSCRGALLGFKICCWPRVKKRMNELWWLGVQVLDPQQQQTSLFSIKLVPLT